MSSIRPDEEVFGKGAKYKVPDVDVLSDHVARKAAVIEALVPVQQAELEKTEMHKLFHELEMPLSRILADMEKQGILVNVEELRALGKEFEAQIATLVNEIYSIAGVEFNLNSPKQLGEILFDKLGLPVIKKTKTGYSTDAEVLEKLAPIMILYKTFCSTVPLPNSNRRMLKDCLKKFRRKRVRCIRISGRQLQQLDA